MYTWIGLDDLMRLPLACALSHFDLYGLFLMHKLTISSQRVRRGLTHEGKATRLTTSSQSQAGSDNKINTAIYESCWITNLHDSIVTFINVWAMGMKPGWTYILIRYWKISVMYHAWIQIWYRSVVPKMCDTGLKITMENIGLSDQNWLCTLIFA